MFICACFLWDKAKQYSYFQLWVRAALFSFRLIDFYCAFHFPCEMKLWVLFSIRSYIFMFDTYTYILLLLQYDLSSSHSTQTNNKNLLNSGPEFHPQLQKIKLFPACSSGKEQPLLATNMARVLYFICETELKAFSCHLEETFCYHGFVLKIQVCILDS